MSKWNGLERRAPLKRTPFKTKPSVCRKPSKAMSRSVSKASLSEQLDRLFSLYIRLRDAMPGGRTVCISCGRQFPFSQMQAGHYYTRHHMSVRWDEANVHSQCFECNCIKSGNIDSYKVGLERKIGAEQMFRLSVLHNQDKKWSDDELMELIAHYRKEVRQLSKEKAIPINI